MNKIGMYTKATFLTASMMLSGCNATKFMKLADESQRVVQKSTSKDAFCQTYCDIFDKSKTNMDYAKNWIKAAEEIKIKSAIDSTRKAVLDSIRNINTK